MYNTSHITYKGENMLCPVCNVDLQLSERSGVEIDYCPKCRGVWLDRGELDKIIERSDSGDRNYRDDRRDSRDRDYERDRRYDDKRYDDRNYKNKDYRPHKKKESFLSDLFDF